METSYCFYGLFVFVMGVSSITVVPDGQIRLMDGPPPYRGRVEIFHDGAWGTICDDKFDTNACTVVCKQLGYSGGTITKEYGDGSGSIWLDEVACDGSETQLINCMHTGWGITNCNHSEDIGCNCNAPTEGCTAGRHTILPFDANYPGIGRAEIVDDSGNINAICDDFWDDVDASIFCTCAGYTNTQHHRAYWNQMLLNMQPARVIKYFNVQCTPNDLMHPVNLWECAHTTTGTCDSNTESAAVACQPLPLKHAPERPVVNLSCTDEVLNVCFQHTTYAMEGKHLRIEGQTSGCTGITNSTLNSGVCLHIPIYSCQQHVEASNDTKKFCYDVTYNPNDGPVSTEPIWTVEDACCTLSTSGKIHSAMAILNDHMPGDNVHDNVTFDLVCYENETFAFPIEANLPLHLGQELICRVLAQTKLPGHMLVVPDCQLLGEMSGTPSLQILQNRCPTSELFVSTLTSGLLDWSFIFELAKFEGLSSLYISCKSFICDIATDSKDQCDRSCKPTSRRRRRDLDLEDEGLHKSSSLRDLINLRAGPIFIQDNNAGPYITADGIIRRMTNPVGDIEPMEVPSNGRDGIKADDKYFKNWRNIFVHSSNIKQTEATTEMPVSEGSISSGATVCKTFNVLAILLLVAILHNYVIHI